jgi:murein DD-endopeptidase MepM/ murein hydrolase activator NlpD
MGVEQPPVRFVLAGVALACLVVFTGTLSYGLTGRSQTAEAPAQGGAPTTKAPVVAVKPAAAKPKPVSTRSKPAATAEPSAAHVVMPGETLTAIERLYQVDVAAIRRANDLSSDQIRAGQRLLIPGVAPLRRHIVVQGDSLWELGARYGVDIESLLQANATVDNPGHLQIGQELVIPHGAIAVATAVEAGTLPDPALDGEFAWPVLAPISSEFGPRWGRNHNGLDLAANMGDSIKAARDGEVLLAGIVQGYGETVILQHTDGTRTLYAHCSKLLVKQGQQVKQGQVIALVGSTGQSTGPHLHFEIIVNDKPRNPLTYLPKR